MSSPAPARGDALRLCGLGFATLFLELALIRFLAGTIWNLGYFPNLVLIAVFVGMGLGFVLHHRLGERASLRVFEAAPFLLLLLVTVVTELHPTLPGFDRWGGDLGGDLYFTATPGASAEGAYLSFAGWFLGVLVVFAGISQRTAKLFRRFSPLRAYSLDILGSCAGIAAFMAVSGLQLPAWSWFLLATPLFALTGPERSWRWGLPVFPLFMCAALAVHADTRLLASPDAPFAPEVHWSPYQKLEYAGGQIFANGIVHQSVLEPESISTSFYQIPHARRRAEGRPAPARVLILGAGAGNDVYAALENGAGHVDAVDIDPAIVQLGRDHHPGAPYADARVEVTVDDGRAFLTRARPGYDLIVFALTDSIVKISPMSQLRLENYLFTVESVRRAWSLLADGGEIVFYNHYREDWLIEKLAGMIREATGHRPAEIGRWEDFAVLSVVKDAATASAAAAPSSLPLPRDDWPFLYLKERRIPTPYLWAMGGLSALVVLLLASLHRLGAPAAAGEGGAPLLGVKVCFLLMGVAFLLLETKSIIQFSLLFGTTWVNNSLVFLGILVLVLLANAIAPRVPRRLELGVFALLLASCGLSLAVPLAGLLEIGSGALRFAAASLLTFSPIFFANLLFSVVFRDQAVAEHLFGWNLIGATLGGVVEYTSLALGYDALAVVVAALYAAAFGALFLARRTAGGAAATPVEGPRPPATDPARRARMDRPA